MFRYVQIQKQSKWSNSETHVTGVWIRIQRQIHWKLICNSCYAIKCNAMNLGLIFSVTVVTVVTVFWFPSTVLWRCLEGKFPQNLDHSGALLTLLRLTKTCWRISSKALRAGNSHWRISRRISGTARGRYHQRDHESHRDGVKMCEVLRTFFTLVHFIIFEASFHHMSSIVFIFWLFRRHPLRPLPSPRLLQTKGKL